MNKRIIIPNTEKTIELGKVIYTKVYGICEGMPIIIRYSIHTQGHGDIGIYTFLFPGNPSVKKTGLSKSISILSDEFVENLIKDAMTLGIELYQID